MVAEMISKEEFERRKVIEHAYYIIGKQLEFQANNSGVWRKVNQFIESDGGFRWDRTCYRIYKEPSQPLDKLGEMIRECDDASTDFNEHDYDDNLVINHTIFCEIYKQLKRLEKQAYGH